MSGKRLDTNVKDRMGVEVGAAVLMPTDQCKIVGEAQTVVSMIYPQACCCWSMSVTICEDVAAVSFRTRVGGFLSVLMQSE